MKKTVIASAAAAALLVTAAPALAHDGKENNSVRAEIRADLKLKLGEWKKEWKEHKAEWKEEWKERWAEKRSHVAAGKVESTSGSTIVIDAFGKQPTTTIVTDANTVFKFNGEATTSAAVTTGAKIFAIGTTTATSTSGNTFTASIVHIFTKGFGHIKHWFWHK